MSAAADSHAPKLKFSRRKAPRCCEFPRRGRARSRPDHPIFRFHRHRGNPRPLRDDHRDKKQRQRDPRRDAPPGVRGAPGNNRDGAAAGQAKRGYKIPLLPRMKMNFRSGKGGILPQFMRGGGETIGNRRRQKTPRSSQRIS